MNALSQPKTPNLDAALKLAAQGLYVFPAGADKRPLCRWRDVSTNDPSRVAGLWRDNPGALPAIDCGRSGLVVVDCDRHGGPDGVAAFEKLAQGEVFDAAVQTPRNGLHVFFRQPDGERFGNARGGLPNGVDVRGEGGYVIAPGARLPDGRGYECPNFDAAKIPILPDDLAAILRAKPSTATSAANDDAGSCTRYGEAALRSECAKVAGAAEGERNNALNRAAFAIGQLVASHDVDEALARARLAAAAAACGLPADEALRTIASGFEGGRQKPRLKDASVKDKPHAAPFGFTANGLQIQVFPPVTWVVPDILPEGCTILAGRPKLGKSWLSLDIAYAVASGGTVLGDKQCAAGDVLYLGLEDNPRRLQSRLNKMRPFEDWPERLTFATEWPRAGDGGLDRIEAWAASVPSARLVIVDVLTAFRDHPGRGENKSTYATDYEAVQGLRDLGNRLGLAILVVHHTRKGESDDPIEAVSGTLGLSGAADTILVLNRKADTGVTLYGRGRDIPEMDLALSFSLATCRWNALGNTGDVVRTDERAQILSVHIDAAEPISPKEISIGAQMPRNSVDQLLFKMAKAGEVLKTGRGKYVHPTKSELIAASNSFPHKNDKKIRNLDEDDLDASEGDEP